nr:MAG TPA: hypothetical protein [Caudoviricetes sp.]
MSCPIVGITSPTFMFYSTMKVICLQCLQCKRIDSTKNNLRYVII